MWIWKRVEKIGWLVKVTNEEVLRRVNEDRQILNSIWQRKRVDWPCFETRRHEIIEGRMRGEVSQQEGGEEFKCYILANDGGFVALKRAAEDREVWRHRERMSKACCKQKTADGDTDCIDIAWNECLMVSR